VSLFPIKHTHIYLNIKQNKIYAGDVCVIARRDRSLSRVFGSLQTVDQIRTLDHHRVYDYIFPHSYIFIILPLLLLLSGWLYPVLGTHVTDPSHPRKHRHHHQQATSSERSTDATHTDAKDSSPITPRLVVGSIGLRAGLALV
jgi:hypothetical protein